MFSKIEITGKITSVTGMHIGGSSQFAAIGAIDSPVIRDAYNDLPMIPGSSLKGKMRSLLARQYNDRAVGNPNEDDERLLRLFGSSDSDRLRTGRLIFSDMFMSNADRLKSMDVRPTEVKFENTINRATAVANPRQIERSVRGAEYGLSLIYNVDSEEEMLEDMKTLRDGMKLLQYDYIGGSGSRGYGKIKFSDLELDCVIGSVDDALIQECADVLKDVE